MVSLDKTNANALAQRALRLRRADLGLVPVQVYIREEHRDRLKRIEQALRLKELPTFVYNMDHGAMSNNWTTDSLFKALVESEYGQSGQISLKLVESMEPVIHVESHDHGDLQMQIVVAGSAVHASTVLCQASQVKDRAVFNEACLRLNTLYPLSSLGLVSVDGEDIYSIFGQLSARSPLANVIEEIHTLGHNALQAAGELHSYIY